MKSIVKSVMVCGLLVAANNANAFFQHSDQDSSAKIMTESNSCRGNVLQIGGSLKNIETVKQAGNNVDLTVAIQSIIPKGWVVRGEGVSTLVSWEKGETWAETVFLIVKQSQACVTLDWTSKIIYINSDSYIKLDSASYQQPVIAAVKKEVKKVKTSTKAIAKKVKSPAKVKADKANCKVTDKPAAKNVVAVVPVVAPVATGFEAPATVQLVAPTTVVPAEVTSVGKPKAEKISEFDLK